MWYDTKKKIGCESKIMLDTSIYEERISRVQKELEESGAAFVLLTPSPSFQYLAGYEYLMRERLVALLIHHKSEPCIIVPAFEVSDHSHNTWIKNFITWEEDEDPYLKIKNEFETISENPIVLFDDSMPLGAYWRLERIFSGFMKTLSITPLLNEMRISKSEGEVALIRKAGEIIDHAVMTAFNKAQLGMTEIEVRQIVHNEIIREGAKPTFAAIQFGENSALPHADSSTRELRKGDLVLMDCGCSLDGYNTDMTRVGVAGTPTEEMKRVHSIVTRAEETSIAKISRGMTCGTADGIARRIIEDEGYGDYFTHRLGHGIGLEVHEPPYLVRGSAETLDVGMCHSIEPGIYLNDRFGIRIEDLVCIQEDHTEVLTYSPRTLIEMNL
ncbi:aminopeptidase P family protein [Candidatus Thorarchaeota archaeon]|nr:MAG: aminopeptidase P family protein [Candidatus Thorarchaeota archaeon]